MIASDFCDIDFYCYVIHRFMCIEKMNERAVAEKFFLSYIPKYLYKEQKEKCFEVLNDLFYRTKEQMLLDVDAFHELMLYHVLRKMEDKQKHSKNFRKVYFDETACQMIEILAQKELLEYSDFSFEKVVDGYYDVKFYSDILLSDLDFLEIEAFYNHENSGDITLLKQLGINPDYYLFKET